MVRKGLVGSVPVQVQWICSEAALEPFTVAPGPGCANCISFLPSHSPGPRLVFNRVNGRRPLTTSPSLEGSQETYTLAHEENVRFVSEGSKGPGGVAQAIESQ